MFGDHNIERATMREYGWLVHGIRRAQQAVSILRHIPYGLIVLVPNCPECAQWSSRKSCGTQENGERCGPCYFTFGKRYADASGKQLDLARRAANRADSR